MRKSLISGLIAVSAVACVTPSVAAEWQSKAGVEMAYAEPASVVPANPDLKAPVPMAASSGLINMPLHNASGQKVGQIRDLIIAPSGKVVSLVVRTHGENIAVAFEAIEMTPGNDGRNVVTLRDDIRQLKSTAHYELAND